jgi:hypothetical protein
MPIITGNSTTSSYISPHSENLIIKLVDGLHRCRGHDHTSNFNSELWPVVRPRRDIFNLAQREHAVDDFSKDDMLPVEEIARRSCDEELRPIIRGACDA